MKYFTSLLLVLLIIFSCNTTSKNEVENESVIHKCIVQEVLHIKEYSYIRVLEDGIEKWIAAPTTVVEIGSTYYFGKTMEMQDFESKGLNKTFETIYFVEKLSSSEADAKLPLTTNLHPLPVVTNNQTTTQEATKQNIEKKNVKVEASENTISFAKLFKNKEKYNNKTVTLKGEVTKFNPAIMGVNWIHMQDGTEFNGEFDLTVTTSATVQIGDVITLEGTVTLNKDFGAGYFYAIIIENATLIN